MRTTFALVVSLLLAACGGGGGGGDSSSSCDTCSTGSTIPTGTVSGIAFDGLIINGAVRVYDFTGGQQGALVGRTTTDSNGLYTLQLQIESRPLLIEITGGYYIEESDGVSVALSTGHRLTAVSNYKTGSTLSMSVTTYTHWAAGLATHLIARGTAVADAITTANQRLSTVAGVDITTTIPKDITSLASASAALTPGLKYGFLAGGISTWTQRNAPSSSVAHQPPYTSIDFAQLGYTDIAADGVLDGVGSQGASLSFGAKPLGASVYRYGIGVGVVQMANNSKNKTGLGSDKLMSFASTYVGGTEPLFGSAPVVSFTDPVFTVSSPASASWLRRTVTVQGAASSDFDIASIKLSVDDTLVSTATTMAGGIAFNTKAFADGAHNVKVAMTDGAGRELVRTFVVNIDNTAPTITNVIHANVSAQYGMSISGYAADAGGIDKVTIITGPDAGASRIPCLPGQCIDQYSPDGSYWDGYWLFTNLASTSSPVLRATDHTGNCQDFDWTGALISSAACQ